MKVCFFGGYNRDYPRNLVLRRAFESIGVEVVECNESPRLKTIYCYMNLLKKFFRMPKKGMKYIVVPEFNHRIVPLAFVVSRLFGKKLIFDPLISMYDSIVYDRRLVDGKSLKGRYYHVLDRLPMLLSNYVLADTELHSEYYIKEFKCKKHKVFTVPVGADESVFKPMEGRKIDNTFHVLFWGTFIPLHGIEHILHAAKLLEKYEDIRFTMIGSGQMFGKMKELAQQLRLKNVVFTGRIELEQLPVHMASADVSLGIFGDSDKAKRVVANKVFSALAMGKAVVTSETPATSMYFKDGYDMVLVEPGSAQDIANAIVKLKENPGIIEEIGRNGLATYNKRFSTQKIGCLLKEIMAVMEKK